MSCNAHFEVLISRTLPAHIPRRVALRLQNYKNNLTYTKKTAFFVQFYRL